jgi:5-methylcytosine-specific restriction protein A
VTLGDVTREGVLAAVEEFDRLGRAAFLKLTGFGPAKAYFLEYDGEFYDSKAIVGYAHGVSTGVLLRPGDFSGGDKTVAQRLETLGFKVANLDRPNWTRHELVLACALAETNGWRQVYDTDPRAKELSQLLQSPAIHPFPRHPDFRNPAGVGQKTRNIVDHHPDHRDTRSNGNRLDKEVLDAFLADPDRMHAIAAQIREVLAHATARDAELPDLDVSDAAAGEKRAQRREQVRSRVEAVLGRALREVGPDYILPDGRLVAIYYSKIHDDGSTFLGLKNRTKNDDILVLLLGDETYPKHLVFPQAESLLRHKEGFRPVGHDRRAPYIYLNDGSFVLRPPSKGLAIPLDDRIDAYHELLYPPDQAEAGTTPIGRTFVEDDEDAAPRPAAPAQPNPDLVGRGNRAHRRTRNKLAAHLKSLGIQPLDPMPSDPPFDLAWRQGEVLYVAEVKSLTRANEEHQLRLGLGQLLRYSHLLRKRVEYVVPVLVPEQRPRDPEWDKLCKALSVRLACPPGFEALGDHTAVADRLLIRLSLCAGDTSRN